MMPFVALTGPLGIFYALLFAADTFGTLLGLDLGITAFVVLYGLHPAVPLLVTGMLLVPVFLCTLLSLCHNYTF